MSQTEPSIVWQDETPCKYVSLLVFLLDPSRMKHGVDESSPQEVVMRRVPTPHTPGLYKSLSLCRVMLSWLDLL